MKKIDEFFQKYADRLVWVFISAYIVIFSCLCFMKYRSFHYFDWDLASDAVVLWNSVHGRMLYYPFLDGSIFGAHIYLIAFLVMPLYAVFQTPLLLLFLQSFFLGMAAYPLYLIARSKLGKSFALVIAAAYLFYPPLGNTNLFETHFETYAVFFLFFALYYFEAEKFWKFLVFALLAVSCKENIGAAIFMIGVYGLVRRRSARWTLLPMALGAAWFIISIGILIPMFAESMKLKLNNEGYMFMELYKHFGKGILGVTKGILLEPLNTIKFAFTPGKLSYLAQIFAPLAFTPLLAPSALIMAIPLLMQNLLSSKWTFTSIHYHYTALLIPFMFFASVLGIERILRAAKPFVKRINLKVIFLAVAVASSVFLKAPQTEPYKIFKMYRIDEYSKEKEKILDQIPKDASVIATFQFLPRLANRYDIYPLNWLLVRDKMYAFCGYEPAANLGYALIDFNEPLITRGAFFPPSAPGNIRSFLEAGDWRVARAFNDTVLFRKGYVKGPKLCEMVVDPKIQYPMNVDLNKEILFLGYDIVDDGAPDSKLLHMVYYWKRIKGSGRPTNFFIQFLDAGGNVRFSGRHVFGYRVYLRDEWKQGQILKEHYYVLIPSGLEKGDYNISFGPFVFEEDADHPERPHAE